MTASVRDRLLDAMLAQLNTGRPAGVPAADDERQETYKPEELPAITVAWLREEDEPQRDSRWSYYLKRTMTFRVRIRVAADPPRKAIDPLYVWVGQQLGGKQFDGLGDDCHEALAEMQYAAEDQPYAMLELDFRVYYETLKTDPTATQ